MAISFFGILVLALFIGLMLAMAKARHPWRWILGLAVGAGVAVVLIAGLVMVKRVQVERNVALQTQSPGRVLRNTYPMGPESTVPENVTVGPGGISVKSGSSSVVIRNGSVAVTDGTESIHVSSDGSVVMGQTAVESNPRSAVLESDPAATPAPARKVPGIKPTRKPAPTPKQAPAAAAESDEWIDASQADFEADVYPSERSTAVALARRMIKSWDGVLPPGREPDKILVNEKSNLEPSIVQAVLQTLQKTLGDNRVEMDYSHRGQYIEAMQETMQQMYGSGAPASAPAKAEPDSAVRVTISGDFHEDTTVHSTIGRRMKRGSTVEVTLAGPAGKRTRSASFVSKPWVENGIDRASQQPGQELMVSRSRRLCPSRSEAEQQAVADAANKLIPLVRTALDRLESNTYSNEPSPGITTIRQSRPDHELDSVIRAEMLRGNGVNDQFTQQLRRPYGDVWQHAVLIDASDAQLTRYAQAFLPKIEQARSEHNSNVQSRMLVVRKGAGIVLLTMLIAVVYAFLNAATRGYYTWMLRGSMVLLVLAGAVLLLLMV